MVEQIHRQHDREPNASPQAQGQPVLTQTNPPGLTAAHKVTRPVLRPPITASPAPSFRFSQWPVDGEIHEFLYKVVKPGGTFWIGVAVPKGTTDFSRAQVYFHPTVTQLQFGKQVVVADDADYPEFGGGWKFQNDGTTDGAGMQRYVAMQGGSWPRPAGSCRCSSRSPPWWR